MRILNSKNPKVAAMLIPWLVPTQTESRLQIAAELAERLKQKPGETFCIVAIERNIARAVMIAHVSESRRRSVWIWQSQAEPGFRFSDLMMELLKSWARTKKAREIRMGTDRNARAFERRWGFERTRDDELRLKI